MLNLPPGGEIPGKEIALGEMVLGCVKATGGEKKTL